MTQQSTSADSEQQRPEPTHRFAYTGRAATAVTAIAAAAVITAAAPPASAASTGAVASPTGSTSSPSSAAVPPWQHPSSDPTDNCVL
ncbi:MAG: hypothetical protein ABI418_02645 [Jatrophihabitantaceae bacterium]